MPLPNQIRSARLTNASLASTIDDELANAEKALADILGIPIDTLITAALLRVAAGGLQAVVLQDLGAGDVTAAGEVGRKGAALRFHDGVSAKDVAVGVVGFPAGTNMLFMDAAVPTGWTRRVNATETDRTIILRMNGEVPSSGGTWIISGLTMNNHTHGLGGHTHTTTLTAGFDVNPSGNGRGGAGNPTAVVTSSGPSGGSDGPSTNAVASDGGHRPLHMDVIVGIKS